MLIWLLTEVASEFKSTWRMRNEKLHVRRVKKQTQLAISASLAYMF